ncbi:galactose oxidase/kelch repeat superfamily protein [Wolffia australiana]
MNRVKISSHSPVQKLGHSQLSSSPKFKLAAVSSQSSEAQSMESSPLIPGLPDDVAISCLLRLPVRSLPNCSSVCRQWRQLLGSRERFFTQRKLRGLSSSWLFVLAFDRCAGKVQWRVLDLSLLSWHTIPAMPHSDRLSPHGLRCLVLPDGALLACGGAVAGTDRSLDMVLRFDLQKDRWTSMNRLLTSRRFFAAGLIGGAVYAAGGSVADLAELDSAEFLDLCGGEWRPMPSMLSNLVAYDSAVLDEKLMVTEGWTWPFVFSPRGLSYDPKAESWSQLPTGLREGWTGPSVVLGGHLFVICEHENLRMKVYDKESDDWEAVAGSPVPRKISKPFSVGGENHRICVVGRDLHTAIGEVKRSDRELLPERKKASFSVRWLVHDAPQSLRGSTPSTALLLHG